MKQFECNGSPASVFLPSFFPSCSSIFPCHPPTRGVHRSSPCLRHCFIPSVYLYRLSLFPCNILFLTPAIHPASDGLPTPALFPSILLYLIFTSLPPPPPEAPQHRPPLPPLHVCSQFTSFTSRSPLIKPLMPSSVRLYEN